MTLATDPASFQGLRDSSQGDSLHDFYEPSVASSASSSQISVFSDVSSTQSSIASSVSDDFRLSQDEIRDRSCPRAHLQQQQAKSLAEQAQYEYMLNAHRLPQPSYAEVTSASEQHQNPRRNSLARHQKPPTLVRQCERKVNFVDNLVDSATQMVEVIWPLTGPPHCSVESSSGKGVLPLRTYIEETLRRSRTSYSTLQVALYYLVLIRPFVPRQDFTMEQPADCAASRALQCGRRMFLAALILASKYLQDRNYSAKAWSKMSGLKVNEINSNERTFLAKVNWKLHIPDCIFKRWTEIVLRYTPNMPPPSPPEFPGTMASWKSIIPLLTPELDKIPLPPSKRTSSEIQCTGNWGVASPTTPTPSKNSLSSVDLEDKSNETTPTPATVLPRFLEPKPDVAPPTPALARMGTLPTPSMTPSSIASSTPAVSACNSRRPSMTSAMVTVQRAALNRCMLDQYPGSFYDPMSRRPSICTASSRSSPESMISDVSHLSRASSISSISTVSTNSSMALGRACLARQATCRNVGFPSGLPASVKEETEGSATKPIVIADDAEMTSSPEMIDFTVKDKVLSAPHRHSKYAPHPQVTSAHSAEKSRKRARPRGGRRSDLQEEVRMLLEEEMDDMDLDRDDFTASPSPAAESASRMVGRSMPYSATMEIKENQPPASLSNEQTMRIPMQKYDGKKRRCCSSSAMSITPSPLYGEVAN